MRRIRLDDGRVPLYAYLNDTLAAADFARRLPCRLSGSEFAAGYCFPVASGIFDPMELRAEWERGDLCLCSGYFVLLGSRAREFDPGGNLILIGKLEKASLEQMEQWSGRVTLCIAPAPQKEITMKIENREEFDSINAFGTGAPNDAYAVYFTGHSFLNPLTKPGQDPLFLANVTFEPGCRNNWHIHHADKGGGQILICTAGEGWYQEEGKEAVSLTPGKVIVIPAGFRHWHGAKKDSWFAHISLEVPGENTSTEWLSPVTDAEYDALKD